MSSDILWYMTRSFANHDKVSDNGIGGLGVLPKGFEIQGGYIIVNLVDCFEDVGDAMVPEPRRPRLPPQKYARVVQDGQRPSGPNQLLEHRVSLLDDAGR